MKWGHYDFVDHGHENSQLAPAQPVLGVGDYESADGFGMVSGGKGKLSMYRSLGADLVLTDRFASIAEISRADILVAAVQKAAGCTAAVSQIGSLVSVRNSLQALIDSPDSQQSQIDSRRSNLAALNNQVQAALDKCNASGKFSSGGTKSGGGSGSGTGSGGGSTYTLAPLEQRASTASSLIPGVSNTVLYVTGASLALLGIAMYVKAK